MSSGSRIKLAFLVAGILVFFSNCYAATCDCDTTVPTWYLDGTKCEITPYYYKIEIHLEIEASYEQEQYPQYWSWSGSGWSIEYAGYNGASWFPYACLEPVYSNPTDPNNVACDFEMDAVCFSARSRVFCLEEDSYIASGSWSDKIFTGTDSYDDHYEEEGFIYNYYSGSTTTITAVFDHEQVPVDCRPDPSTHIKDYQKVMFVRPKDAGGCCEWSNAQTITYDSPAAWTTTHFGYDSYGRKNAQTIDYGGLNLTTGFAQSQTFPLIFQ